MDSIKSYIGVYFVAVHGGKTLCLYIVQFTPFNYINCLKLLLLNFVGIIMGHYGINITQ
jgi:hypothetical protein